MKVGMLGHEVENALLTPASGSCGVFVQEVAAPGNLQVVQLESELEMADRTPEVDLKLVAGDLGLVPLHQAAEPSTHGGPYEQQRLLVIQKLPGTPAVGLAIEVPAGGQVE